MITGGPPKVSGVADVERWVRRAGPVAAVFALLLLVMTVAVLSGPRVTRLPVPQGTREAPTPPPADEPAPVPTTTSTPFGLPDAGPAPVWLRVVVLVMGLLVVVGVVIGLAYLLRRYAGRIRLPSVRRSVPEVVTEAELLPPAPDEIRAAVDAGIHELADDASDPRQAVIGCWLRLEAAAAAAGTPRRPDDTPADLVARMLAAHQVTARPLRGLAELYRQARYARGDVDEEMRTRARSILGQVRAELSRPERGTAEGQAAEGEAAEGVAAEGVAAEGEAGEGHAADTAAASGNGAARP